MQADHISDFLKSRISDNSVVCGSNKKAVKTVNAKHIKHKEITNKNKMKHVAHSVESAQSLREHYAKEDEEDTKTNRNTLAHEYRRKY